MSNSGDDHPGVTALVDALAVYRLVRLVQQDTITEKPRAALMRRFGAHKWSTILDCPWCASPYVAVLVIAARWVCPHIWDPAARILAFSAVTGVLSEAVEHLENPNPRE
jgi:hypothetical protein